MTSISLCLTYKVNLGLSFRKTAQALNDIHGISISHQQVANYCKTASVCIKPFIDNYDYKTGNVFTADETYIKIRGIKTYIWFIMDAAKRSVIGYQVSEPFSFAQFFHMSFDTIIKHTCNSLCSINIY